MTELAKRLFSICNQNKIKVEIMFQIFTLPDFGPGGQILDHI